MPRIAKKDVHASFERAAQVIRDSDIGKDGRFSRADIKAKLDSMPKGTEKSLVNMFYKYADHRDSKKYAKLTGSDLVKTLAYSKEKLVNKYDKNNNGLSKAEIAKMKTTAKLAVKLAQELKAAEKAQVGREVEPQVVSWS
jgi:hypothetical protein